MKTGTNASTSAPLGSKPEDYDRRRDALFKALESLTEQQWYVVGQRYLERKRQIVRAKQQIDGVAADIVSGKAKPFGRTEAKRRAVNKDAGTRITAAVAKLPETVVQSGKAQPLRDPAEYAVYYAVVTLKVFAELDRVDGGRAWLATILSPFEGLVEDILT